MKTRRLKAVVGRAERLDFPDCGVSGVPAKIDTGAYRTSVWASDIKEEDGLLKFKLMGPESEFYSGQECVTDKFKLIEVENSFGHKQERYSIALKIRLGTKKVKTIVTLADRSQKIYPVLVGRRMLRGRYLVDVAEGDPIEDEETQEL